MSAFFQVPKPVNEPVFNYEPGSPERETLKQEIENLRSTQKDVPMYIGGQKVYTDNKQRLAPPHDHKHTLGQFSLGGKEHVEQAIEASLKAKKEWENMSWENRAAIFLKAADLISGPYRAKVSAATMLGQSKNAYQAEIDTPCEMADFLRFNAYYAQEIFKIQPESVKDNWNRLEYRPLEGFIFALTPFNFTAIAGNLPTAPAMVGNTVVWKPAFSQVYAASLLMEIFMEAGLPDGVINLIYVDGPQAGDVIFKHPEFSGLHFTGSTKVFENLWKTISENISTYRNYPRIVGETGGKDFILAHPTADPRSLAIGILRGAFEFQGQKCSAASRSYVPESIWEEVKGHLVPEVESIKVGPVEDFSNFVNAVIDEKAFDKITGYIEEARKDPDVEVLCGGTYSKETGYFVDPTVLVTKNPKSLTMREEIFGPVITIYVYKDEEFDNMVELTDTTSPYGLTGALFCKDKKVVEDVTKRLRHAAGNFYINDKPTGAVVGQQPFGGSRASGTNDKAGSIFNMIRWVSPRTLKENFNPPQNYQYPFMGDK